MAVPVREWIIYNLISSSMLHISVVPGLDIKYSGGISKYETIMTHIVQQRMGRDDVRVLVQKVPDEKGIKYFSKWGNYNARLIFLGKTS